MKVDPPELFISSLETLTVPESSSPPIRENETHEADVISHEVEHREAMAAASGTKSSVITKEVLPNCWLIGLEPAARTLQASTQCGMRYVEGPLE